MRVIAGELKGRKLLSPKSVAVRPTSDRVRESIFGLLGDVRGARALDLYAGSGALGIEALSRGAVTATFVDSARSLPIGENLSRLGIEGRGAVYRARCERFLDKAARRGDRWDLVFVDPPYRLADQLVEPLQRLLPPVLKEGSRLVLESSPKKPLKLALPMVVERTYGDTLVAIYRMGR